MLKMTYTSTVNTFNDFPKLIIAWHNHVTIGSLSVHVLKFGIHTEGHLYDGVRAWLEVFKLIFM